MDLELLPDRMILRMNCCPSLSKVLDSDAEPCPKYCDHCGGWGVPLYIKCGIYYVGNMIGRTEPRCEIVYTELREIAREVYRKFLDDGYAPDLIQTNLDDWEEVERNKNRRG